MFASKVKASLIHFGISIFLVGISIGSVIFFFFPSLFIDMTDFKAVASIIISVDLVLGPLLTFVVFQPQKKSLKFDLSVIAVVQLTALIYGAYSLYLIHPVYVAFNVDRFTLVSAKNAEPETATLDEFKVSKLTTAKFAFAKTPSDPKKQSDLLFSVAEKGDLDMREEYYEPIKDNLSEVLAKSLDPKLVLKDKNASKFLLKNKNTIDHYAFLPLTYLDKDAVLVIDKKTADPIATLNIDPWKISQK